MNRRITTRADSMFSSASRATTAPMAVTARQRCSWSRLQKKPKSGLTARRGVESMDAL